MRHLRDQEKLDNGCHACTMLSRARLHGCTLHHKGGHADQAAWNHCASCGSPRCRTPGFPVCFPAFRAVPQVSYVVSEAEYGAMEAEGGWAGRLVMALGALAGQLRPHLTANNWEVLFGGLLDKVRGGACVG